ncbi:MAG: threonylcarbamoyl-AMP synthase [Elusimicrobia bacterium]|nr:threonylcarbamoyl-AMP synthase [Elusimicrobiota bacterium]
MNEIVCKYSENTIKRAASILKRGGIVAFPTETVYGLGACARYPGAVAKIFKVKKRPLFDPLIVHISDPRDVDRLCRKVSRKSRKLIERFWPGPLTLIMPKSDAVPDIVTAGLPTVAVRMPAHPVALELIKKAGVPVAAPSANPFGYISPTTARHVAEQIGGKVDLIIDGGACPVGIESTVLDMSAREPVILRPGGLPVEEIERVIGKVKISRRIKTVANPSSLRSPGSSSSLCLPSSLRSPGQLSRHYSPSTPVKIINDRDFRIFSENNGSGKAVGIFGRSPCFTYGPDRGYVNLRGGRKNKPVPAHTGLKAGLLAFRAPVVNPAFFKSSLKRIMGKKRPAGKGISTGKKMSAGNVIFFRKIEILSVSGDLCEAAANLFSSLHKLDDAGLDIIYAEKVPERGLGAAIMDRLRKAEGRPGARK